MLSWSLVCELAAKSIRQAQGKYKAVWNWKSVLSQLKVGDLFHVKFPQDETGMLRKLSWPWHGLNHIVSQEDPDVSVVKILPPWEVNPCSLILAESLHVPVSCHQDITGVVPRHDLLDALVSGNSDCWVKVWTCKIPPWMSFKNITLLLKLFPHCCMGWSKLPDVSDEDGGDKEVDFAISHITERVFGRSSCYNLRTRFTAPAKLMLWDCTWGWALLKGDDVANQLNDPCEPRTIDSAVKHLSVFYSDCMIHVCIVLSVRCLYDCIWIEMIELIWKDVTQVRFFICATRPIIALPAKQNERYVLLTVFPRKRWRGNLVLV